MPSALLYVATVGATSPDAFLAVTRPAIQAAGYVPGPWTAAQITVPVESAPVYSFPASASPTGAQQAAALRLGNDVLNASQRAALASSLGMQVIGAPGLYGTSGPFAGVYFGDAPSPTPASVTISAFKQVIVGPVITRWSSTIASQVASSLNVFNSAAAPWGSTPIGDRGVPQNPTYSEAGAGSSSNFGILFGLLAVAGLAWAAREKTAPRPAALRGTGLGVSRNRERMTFEEWSYAAGMDPRKAKPGAHAAWIKGEDPSEWRAEMRVTNPGRRAGHAPW